MSATRLRPSPSRGFGLVELMAAIAVLAALMLFVWGTFFRTEDESDRVRRLIEFRQSARAALQLLERDVRMSGSGWGRLPVNVSNNGTPTQMWAVTPGNGTGLNDSLTIMGAWAAATTLSSSMPLETSTLQVANVSGFAVNDLVVITNGNSPQLFQVTGINTGTRVLSTSSSSPWNVAGGHANWPAGGYGSGTPCFKVSMLTYRVDSLNFGRPCLVRQELGGQPQVVAYDLNKFQVWYRMQDNTLVRNPGGVVFVDKILPRIAIRVTDRNRPTIVDSVWAEVRPRTFD